MCNFAPSKPTTYEKDFCIIGNDGLHDNSIGTESARALLFRNSNDFDGSEATSTIYVTVPNTGSNKAEFTEVVR